MIIYPELNIDQYKISHKPGYPKGTTNTLSTWTPRGSKIAGVNEVVVAGHQVLFVDVLINDWNKNFFQVPKTEVMERYIAYCKGTLFQANPDASHIEALHDLGYLPLEIRALDEGTIVPLRTPTMTFRATKDEFFWLPTYLETQMSNTLWPVYTAATLSHESRKNVDYYGMKTVGELSMSPWLSHNFSARGMMGGMASALVDVGHLMSFFGSDTVAGTMLAEQVYKVNVRNFLISGSVNALEHSTQMAGIEVYLKEGAADRMEAELEFIKYLITEVFPTGIVSIVMDTHDYFGVISNLHKLKDVIMSRDGKLVCRPDSSPKTPFEIIVGDTLATDPLEYKGTLDILWEQFGGTMSVNGYKLLDSHIGVIYGDSITIQSQKAIMDAMMHKGYASPNVVYGLGSFTFQYNTRDTFGFAMKEVGIVNKGEWVSTSKNPKTDNGTKKSQHGAVAVYMVDGKLTWTDGLTMEEADNFKGNLLTVRFKDGILYNETSLGEVRDKLTAYRNTWLASQGLEVPV